MILYRKEWAWVRSRLDKMASPSLEMRTLSGRVSNALMKSEKDPIYLAITIEQTHWINSRCRLLTLHQRRTKSEAI